MVLRGSVAPQTDPVMSPLSQSRLQQFRSPTPVLEDQELRRERTVSLATLTIKGNIRFVQK